MNSMWKRSFALLLSLVMVFGMVPVNAFAEEAETEHTHSYVEGVCECGAAEHTHSHQATVTAPTCGEAGFTTYTCACGDTYTADEVAATGHSYADGVCSVCGAEEHTHSYEAVVTAPTCGEAGFTTYTCACGDTYTADEVAATGHSYAEGICSVCGAEEPAVEEQNEEAVCTSDENCEADTHNAECPYGPCTTEGCKLAKSHVELGVPCTGLSDYVADPVAKIGETGYASLADAFAAATSGNVVIELQKDATVDIAAHDANSFGAGATTITVNGNGHKLTFNKTNSDWNSITTVNGAKLVLNNVVLADSGNNGGPWNRYDLYFACSAELNSVTSSKPLAFAYGAALNTVTVTDPANVYAVWIRPNGQSVSINGLTVNCGRGIKIDEQYMEADAAKVNLSVSDSVFDTDNKAAIVVKSSAGADITLSNVNISNVEADKVNHVWVDEDSAANFGKVAVTGGNVVVENAGDFNVAVTTDGKVMGYYKTLAEAVAAAADGDTITLADGTYTMVNTTKKLTFKGESRTETIFDFTGNKNTSIAGVNEITFENLTINKGDSYYRGFHHSAKETYKDCDINGVIWTYAQEANFTGCTFNQDAVEYNIWTYGAGKVNFTNCTFNCAGKSVLVYNEGYNGTEVNVTNCKFVASQPATGKAAIEIDSSLLKNNQKFVINIDGATAAEGFDKGSVSGNTLWNNKNGILTEIYINGQSAFDIMKPAEVVAPVISMPSDAVIAEDAAAAAEEIVNNGATVNKNVDTGLGEVDQSVLEEAVAAELPKNITTPLNLETNVDVALKEVKKDEIAFEIEPVVTAYVAKADGTNGEEVAKAAISNEALAAQNIAVTFRLPVPSSITADFVTIVHIHDDNTRETFMRPVEGDPGNRYVVLTLTSFSQIIMSEPKNVAAVIGETSYESVGAAVAAVQEVTGNHTIKLLSNCTGDITIKQHPGVEITIDGKNGNTNHTFSGSIIVQGNSTSDNTVALNIQNINFDVTGITGDNASIMLASGATTDRYTNNVTVSGCSFTDTSKDKSNAAIKQYQSGCSNVTITGCTAIGLHSLVQIKSANNLEISGCNVTESKNGISVGTSAHPEISDCVIDTDGYGIRANTKGEAGKGNVSDLKVEGVTITANDPIVVRYNTAKTYEVTLNGTNSLTGKNAKGYTVIFTEGDDGTYLAPTNGGFVVAGADENMFPAKFEAMVGNYQCYTLQDAVNFAAKHGGTVTLIPDKLTLTNELVIPETTDLKFDLTGKTLELPRLYMDKASTVTITGGTIIGTGSDSTKDAIKTAHSDAELTLNGVTVQDSDRHVVRIEQGTATLNNCTIQYTGKESKVSRILINVGDSETKTGHVTINGGTYVHTSTTIDSGRVVDLKTNSTATITDGTFKAEIADKVSNLLGGNADSYSISGGTYKFDVDAYCADGYYSRKIADKEYQVGKIVLAPEFKWTPDKDYLIDTSLIVRMPEGYTIPAGTVATVTKGSEEVFKLTASTENGVAGSNALIFTFANRGQINSTTKAPVAGDYKITLTDGTNKIAEAEYKITGSHPATAMTVKSYDGSAKTLTLNVPALLGDYAIVVKKGETVISNGQQYCTGHETKDGKFALTTSTDLEIANGTATLKNFPTGAGTYTVELSYRKGTDAAISLGEVIKSVSVELCTVKHGTNTETVLKGTQYTLPAAAEATGKTFKAWKVTDATGSKEYAANAKFTVNSNAEFEVVWNVAASIGDKTYDTLSEALTKATAADTVVVGATAADGTYTIPAGVTVSVNGNKVKAQNDMTMKLENGKAIFTIPARTDSYLGMAMVNDKLIYITKENNASTVSVAINKNGTVGYTGTRIESDSNNYQRPLFEIKDIDGSQTLTNSHVTGTNASMTFKCNAPFGMFHYAFVTNSDGSVTWNMVRDVDYSVVSGSTVMTVNNGFMKKLPVGTYVMHMVYTDSVYGEIVARANFYVTQPAPTYVADKTNPKTGDEIFVPMFVMFSTTAALAVLVMGKKKYF